MECKMKILRITFTCFFLIIDDGSYYIKRHDLQSLYYSFFTIKPQGIKLFFWYQTDIVGFNLYGWHERKDMKTE